MTDNSSNKSWITRLERLDLCWKGLVWAKKQKNFQTAWKRCRRGDWLLWLVGRLSGPPDSPSRRKVVRAALECARIAPPSSNKEVERARQKCLNRISGYVRNRASLRSLQDISQEVADIADFSDDESAQAAAHAAVAAYSTDAETVATCAFNTAYFAAEAAYWEKHILQSKTLKKCAKVVRRYYPKAPRLPKEDEFV